MGNYNPMPRPGDMLQHTGNMKLNGVLWPALGTKGEWAACHFFTKGDIALVVSLHVHDGNPYARVLLPFGIFYYRQEHFIFADTWELVTRGSEASPEEGHPGKASPPGPGPEPTP